MLAVASVLIAGTASGQTIPPGKGELSATLAATTLNVFTYRPANCTPRQLLVVFHGLGRDAGPYRDHARTLADRLCAVAVAPEFDAQRFPTALYQHGGSTVGLVAPLVDWARKAAGQPDMPYILIGHSAGGQFLSRVAAYAAPAASHIVIANPSTWVLPNLSDAAPYGFGGMANGEHALRAYLALPIVVLLGGADTGSHNLSATREAMAQGPNRLARGHNTFEKARSIAQRHGWPFNWTLVEVPGVGHSATNMFKAPMTIAALSGQ
jgi:alpha-beta hydrolase superfamily lysophospholipase